MSNPNPYDPANPRHRIVRHERGVFTPLDGRKAPVAGDELFGESHAHLGAVKHIATEAIMAETFTPAGLGPGDVLTIHCDGVELKRATVGDDGKPRWLQSGDGH